MRRNIFITAFSSLALSSYGVDVSFSDNSQCSNAQVACTDLLQNQCCQAIPLISKYARFTDYPGTGAFFATVHDFPDGGGSGCGPTCNSADGRSSSICIGCPPDDLGGASWALIQSGETERGEQGDCVKPDTAFIGGRAFKLDYESAGNETEALISLAARRASYEEVPEELLKFEKVPVVAK
jgi:hypothetical protein